MLYSTQSIFYLLNFDIYRTFFHHLDRTILEFEQYGNEDADYSYNINSYICNLHPNVRYSLKHTRTVGEGDTKMQYREGVAQMHNTW